MKKYKKPAVQCDLTRCMIHCTSMLMKSYSGIHYLAKPGIIAIAIKTFP